MLNVPQMSTLEPLLFNIHICDIFYETEDLDVAIYTDMEYADTSYA